MEQLPANQERRDVTGFTGLKFKGYGKIMLTQGDHDELIIEALPEVRERIRTEVKEGILSISYESDWKDWTGVRFLTGEKVIFHLTMKLIKSIDLSGVGSLDAAEIITDQLKLALGGPGAITIGSVQVAALEVDLSGVGSIDIAGKAADLTITLSGAGNLQASRLESERVVMKLSGVGHATIWANESLDATISGAGGIEYYGSPKITKRISGVGVLKYLGKR